MSTYKCTLLDDKLKLYYRSAGSEGGMLHIVSKVVRNERLFGLWKGMTPVSLLYPSTVYIIY